ncbi:hypothetical protein NC652_004797 [Populus alba x Populus x berolinensis]|nr:hypothetical protein NC652_004797 [Populus alba x Populus x berolinensis]
MATLWCSNWCMSLCHTFVSNVSLLDIPYLLAPKVMPHAIERGPMTI